MPSILAVDLGDRRTGLAISDPGGTFALGLPLLEAEGVDAMLGPILQIIQDRRIDEVVVGLPRNMDGSLGPRARLTLEFVDRLRLTGGIPVSTWDERLTSAQASGIIAPLGYSRKKKKQQVNVVAAQLILESFLQARRRPASVREDDDGTTDDTESEPDAESR